jgi:hypothetical protein
MINAFSRSLGASLLCLALVSCGGGDGGGGVSGSGGPPAAPAPAVSGIVVDAGTGAAVSGVTVTGAGLSATTGADGSFSFASAPAGNALFLFTSNSHASQARRVNVVPGTTASASAQIVPVAATQTFDPAVGATVTVAGSPAQVVITANTLQTAGGAAPTGQVTARLTPINVATSSALLPGEYTLSAGGGQFESFGALDVTLTDDAGNVLTLAPATTATIRIPVRTRGASPANVALMFFDPATGLWTQDGTATLTLGPPDYYEGTVTHFTNWNAGATYTVSTITACVRDEADQPVAGARIQSDGINYSGTGAAITDASGTALVPMKRSAQAIISATFGLQISNSATVDAGQSANDFTLTPCLVLAAANSGMSITLTWGSSPSDLDSHLRGPNGVLVAYFSRGSLNSPPFAQLDVDDTTGFGPEVITLTRIGRGTYRYFVHNFSRTFTPGQTGSPARVEFRFGVNTQIFTPGAGEGTTNQYWHVFDFIVNADCTVTVTPAQAWSATEPANPSAGVTSELCTLNNNAPVLVTLPLGSVPGSSGGGGGSGPPIGSGTPGGGGGGGAPLGP